MSEAMKTVTDFEVKTQTKFVRKNEHDCSKLFKMIMVGRTEFNVQYILTG